MVITYFTEKSCSIKKTKKGFLFNLLMNQKAENKF